jgi:hypothetical protein
VWILILYSNGEIVQIHLFEEIHKASRMARDWVGESAWNSDWVLLPEVEESASYYCEDGNSKMAVWARREVTPR